MALPKNKQFEEAAKILFDPTDNVGFKQLVCEVNTNSNPESQFFVLNPLKTLWGRARKEDIQLYRNILLEFDTIPLKRQEDIVQSTNLPFSTQTFSGGKSYHYIISLEDPVSLEEYREIVGILHNMYYLADKSCRNPNRLTRTPGAKRLDKNGAVQELVKATARVPNATLDKFLKEDNYQYYSAYKIAKDLKKQKQERIAEAAQDKKGLELLEVIYPNWKQVVENGLSAGIRHERAVGLAIAMFTAGLPEDWIIYQITHFLLVSGKQTAYAEALSIVAWVTQNVVPDVIDEDMIDFL